MHTFIGNNRASIHLNNNHKQFVFLTPRPCQNKTKIISQDQNVAKLELNWEKHD